MQTQSSSLPTKKTASEAVAPWLGLLFGMLLLAGLVDLRLFVPLVLTGVLVLVGRFVMRPADPMLVALLLAKAGWIALLVVVDGGRPSTALFTVVVVDLVLLTCCFVSVRPAFLQALALPLFALLVGDFAFNAWTHAFGADPFGRMPPPREDSIIPRVGGLFHHSFYSANISLVVLAFALLRRNGLMIALAALNLPSMGRSGHGWRCSSS
jgi:hypothetical protein